jgi:hypothetical protein
MRSTWMFVVCAVLWLSAGIARADDPAALKAAQAAFDKAQIDYLQEKYDEAATGFKEAYAAKNFPQFLYNIGAAYHMKGKKNSDPDAYAEAVQYYAKYIAEDPKASDKGKVEKAITVLNEEIARLKKEQQIGPSGTPPQTAPSEQVKSLGDVKVRGLVVIDSEPQNATIYLDDKAKGPVATTPWSGTLEGDHKVIIEKRGYMVSESTVSADPSKLFVLRAVLGKEDFLGWVEVTFSQNIKPGKHKFWVTTEGYDEYEIEVEVVPGGTHEVKANLKGSPVGKVSIVGLGIEDSTIIIDGQVACERGPCLKALQQGPHTITVTREGMKPYSRKINVQAKTETTIKVTLAPKPSRSDAVVAYVLAAGFGGAGIYLGVQANKLSDELTTAIDANPPLDKNDPRFQRGKIYAIAANAAFGLAGITALTAIYYTFRDKGSPSTGLIDVRALALTPQIAPGYAGLGWEMSW